MRILVADDSRTTLALITQSLKKMGHDVDAAANGNQALEFFKKRRPDLIILDVVMEGLNGFECAKRIRAIDSEDWIPIIFLSGVVDDENIAQGINAGGDDYITKPFSEVTLEAKIKAMQRISDMRQKLFEMTKMLKVLSSTDPVTGINNRLQFEKVIAEKLMLAEKNNELLALLFLDLDHFKHINDSFGHPAGDLLLQEVANRLQSCMRAQDFLARLGGDEFAIILSELNSLKDTEVVAKKIINMLSKPYNILGHDIYTSCSIGIAYYPSVDTDQHNLVESADIAMYYAKELGGTNYQYFSKELHNKNLKKIAAEDILIAKQKGITTNG